MTKPRPASSIEAAVLEAIRLIGSEKASEATGRTAQTIRDYSDPERPGQITLAQAIQLDAACFAQNGSRPLLTAFCLQAGVEAPKTVTPNGKHRFDVIPHGQRFLVVDRTSDAPAPILHTQGAVEDYIAQHS
jgi:hypothetical protein